MISLANRVQSSRIDFDFRSVFRCRSPRPGNADGQLLGLPRLPCPHSHVDRFRRLDRQLLVIVRHVYAPATSTLRFSFVCVT